jgi:hypothetical protein
VIGRLARVGGVALDARHARTDELAERALSAGWIAGNLLAARGVKVSHEGEAPLDARIIGVRATDLAGLLAAIAVVPALVDPTTLPFRWRIALRALGLPMLDRAASGVLVAGASVAVLVPSRRQRPGVTSCAVAVGADADGYRVRIAPLRRAQLAA